MPRGDVTLELPPPETGARSDAAPHRLPDTAVPADATANVIVRDGWLVNRPGLKQIISATVTGRPMGGILFRTGASKFTVVGTTSKLYKLNAGGTGWDDLTGTTTPSGPADAPWRFATFPQGGQDHLIAVNRTDLPQQWNGLAATFSDISGGYASGDVTTAANRVVTVDTLEGGFRYVHRTRWSNFNDRLTWGANDFADLSDTPDAMVGCRALSRVAFAIYKENSQWIGLAQSGLVPFKFELQDLKPGPVSPAVVIAAEGRHYYLAVDGSVYVFDGIRATHVGEPIRRYVLQHLNFDEKRRAFGVYSRRDREIYWFFPAVGSDDPGHAVSLNIDSGRFFPHELQKDVSCGFEGDLVSAVSWDDLTGTWDGISATYPTWESFGSASTPVEFLGQAADPALVFRFGVDATDDGTAPNAKWRYQNRQPAGPGRRTRVQSLDSFFEGAGSVLTVTAKVGTTDNLLAEPSFPAELTDTFDISATPTAPPDGPGTFQSTYDADSAGAGTGLPEARYVSVDYSLAASTDFRFGGGLLRAYKLETS